MSLRKYFAGLIVASGFLGSGVIEAAPIFLPLNTITPGTETTTLVPNGNFESPSGFSTSATNWARSGAAYIFRNQDMVNDGFGTYVTRDTTQLGIGDTNNGVPLATGGWNQNVAVTPSTNYVVSVYMWNFSGFGSVSPITSDPSRGPADVHTLVTGTGLSTSIDIMRTDTALLGPPGYFAYTTFNSGTNSSVNVNVFYDGYAGPAGEQIIAAWDNVAITPLATFAPPIPEPVGMSMLLAGGLMLARKRR